VSTTSAWQTLQINLADFSTLTAKNIGQIVLSASTSGGGNSLVYFDNIYFSKTTLGVEELSRNDISIYPNPFSNHIEISAAQAVEQVRVFDIAGKKVLHAAPNKAHFRLHTAHLNKGVYMMSLESAGQSSTAKLIK
ncbi:MAG: T9SS type A sorting domain-containing protein, partial [Flavobacteriaceae bacterium]